MSILWDFLPIIVIIVVYLLVCRIGTVLLTMTGMDQPAATFQALSALTGTGFTTRASEMIVGHEIRRRIVMVLMVVGNLGLAGGVVLLLRLFRGQEAQFNLYRLAALLLLVLAIFWLSGRRKLWRGISLWLESLIQRRPLFRKSTVEELLSFHDNYSIAEIQVQDLDRNVGLKLRNTDFRSRKILVLSIEREGRMIALPSPDETILAGDKLICYGNIESIATSLIQL